jgi:asparagine synthase (glutamine-hydrolysing)
MCSINGIFKIENNLGNVDFLSARKISKLLSYRGPDESGEFFDKNCYLGSNRFSITGIKNGKMPVSNEKGSIWAILNGEIYNYRDLRSELIKLGHIFKTESDTEVIVHLY